MKDDRTVEDLQNELAVLRARVAESEMSQEKFRQASEWFQALVDQLQMGFCIIQDGKFGYVNPNFAQAMGYSEDELLGSDTLQYVFPEDRKEARKNAVKALKGGGHTCIRIQVCCHGRRGEMGNGYGRPLPFRGKKGCSEQHRGHHQAQAG